MRGRIAERLGSIEGVCDEQVVRMDKGAHKEEGRANARNAESIVDGVLFVVGNDANELDERYGNSRDHEAPCPKLGPTRDASRTNAISLTISFIHSIIRCLVKLRAALNPPHPITLRSTSSPSSKMMMQSTRTKKIYRVAVPRFPNPK